MITFGTAIEKGFGVLRLQLEGDGSAMASVGSSIDKTDDEKLAPWEHVELTVRVRDASGMTVEQIRAAALSRAALILSAAAEAVKVQSGE